MDTNIIMCDECDEVFEKVQSGIVFRSISHNKQGHILFSDDGRLAKFKKHPRQSDCNRFCWSALFILRTGALLAGLTYVGILCLEYIIF